MKVNEVLAEGPLDLIKKGYQKYKTRQTAKDDAKQDAAIKMAAKVATSAYMQQIKNISRYYASRENNNPKKIAQMQIQFLNNFILQRIVKNELANLPPNIQKEIVKIQKDILAGGIDNVSTVNKGFEQLILLKSTGQLPSADRRDQVRQAGDKYTSIDEPEQTQQSQPVPKPQNSNQPIKIGGQKIKPGTPAYKQLLNNPKFRKDLGLDQ